MWRVQHQYQITNLDELFVVDFKTEDSHKVISFYAERDLGMDTNDTDKIDFLRELLINICREVEYASKNQGTTRYSEEGKGEEVSGEEQEKTS